MGGGPGWWAPVRPVTAKTAHRFGRLLKQVYDVDALACPRGGRLSFIELVTESDQAREVLQSVGMPTESQVLASDRFPSFVDPIPDSW